MKKKSSTKPFRAKKSLGQNFLVNRGVLQAIVRASNIQTEDTVIEIGPGTGNLTRLLVATGATVTAIEKDHRLITALRDEFPDSTIVEGDVLSLDPATLPLRPHGYILIGNIPYYITSHFIRMLCESWPPPQTAILMVQKEVAQRMLAHVPDTNLLALSTQFYMTPSVIMTVSPGSFSPAPDVTSAMIKLVPRPYRTDDIEKFFSTIRAAFAHKRKKAVSNIADGLERTKQSIENMFSTINLAPTVRPEEISLEQYLRIARMLYS